MNKTDLILKYFQKKNQLNVENKDYQKTLFTLFQWLIINDGIDDDWTSKYLPNITTTSEIISKDDGIIAGLEEIKFLLKTYTKLSFVSKLSDGNKIKKKDAIAIIIGKSHEILAFERTILNILQRMSGIATKTSSIISLIKPICQIQIAATRKTPWMSLDKKAVAVGGGLTHRLNLSDGILIKDNHLALIKQAFNIKSDQKAIGKGLETILGKNSKLKSQMSKPKLKTQNYIDRLIEIEVKSEKEAYSAINSYHKLLSNYQLPITNYPITVMLDNFSPVKAKKLLIDLNRQYDLSAIIFEASGGIDEKNIVEWSKTGVDIISLGALTHSTKSLNLSLEITALPRR